MTPTLPAPPALLPPDVQHADYRQMLDIGQEIGAPVLPPVSIPSPAEVDRTRQIGKEQFRAARDRRDAARYGIAESILSAINTAPDSVAFDAIERIEAAAESGEHPAGDADDYAYSLRGLD